MIPEHARREPLRTAILIAALAVLAGFAVPTLAQGFHEKFEKAHRPQIRVGDVPPDFAAEDLDGEAFSLSETFGRTPVVLDFWATWCPPCLEEIPLLNDFAEEHCDEVTVVAITSEDAENAEAVREFVEEQELVYRIIHDPSREIADSYYVRGIPYLVVIGLDGVVIATHLGYSEDVIEKLEEELDL